MTKQSELKDVQPIRSLEKIDDMKWSLKKWCSERDYILFLLGINYGLRVGDLLKIKIMQNKGQQVVLLREGNTCYRLIIILGNIYDEFLTYVQPLGACEWVFPNRKGDGPITHVQACRQLNKSAQMDDMSDGIGTH